MNTGYSYFIFWMENIVFLAGFFCFEMLLVFPVYLKNVYVMLAYSPGFFTSAFNSARWILLGPFYEVILILMDLKLLFDLCTMH